MREKLLHCYVCLLNFTLLVGFGLICVFVRFLRLFIKKLVWNCHNNLIYYTTDVHLSGPTYQAFIDGQLFLLVTIRENLFFFMRISFFFSFLSVRIPSFSRELFFFMRSLLFVRIYVFMKISKHTNTIVWNESFIIKTW